MARIAIRVCTCALGSVLLAGCSGAGKQASNPFRPRESAVAKADPDRTAWELEDEAGEEADPRTIALISREVPDATAEERRELAKGLEGVDVDTARKFLQTYRVAHARGGDARGDDLGEPRSGSPAAHRAATLAGGHSATGVLPRTDPPARSIDRNPPRNRDADRNPVALAGLGVGPWSDAERSTERSESEPRTGRWPDELPAANTRTAERRDPTGFERFADRLTGVVRPAAAANARPADEADRITLAGDTIPGTTAAERPVPRPPGDTDPDRPILELDVPRDRTMQSTFDGTPPGLVPARTTGDRLDQLIDDLGRSLADEKPGDDPAERLAFVERHVLLRLLYLANDQQERAFVPIPGVDSDEQAFWKSYLWATANYFDAEGIERPEDRAGQAAAQLRDAVRALQTRARLELRHVAFCERISSFGNYDPVDGTDFAAGKEVLVYAEVENFRSEVTADGDYRTLLRSSAEIYDTTGKLMGEGPIDFGGSEDRSRNHRRDFFLAFQFALPNLAPGTYVLKLAVVDELSGRTDTHSLNFTVTR